MTRGEPTNRSLPSRQEIAKHVEEGFREIYAQTKNPDLVERKWRETCGRAAQPVSPVGVDYAHASAKEV